MADFNSGLSMKRRGVFSALVGVAICGGLLAATGPHAREAGRTLAAQDDPAALADLQINSAMRNNPALFTNNVEAALRGGDADLADSFVQLARDSNVAVDDDMSRRVSDAVTEENSSSHFAKRF